MHKSKSTQVGLPGAPAESGQPGALFYLKSKENESGGLFPNILDLPLLWEISRHEDFFSVPVCFSCLNPASPTPQL